MTQGDPNQTDKPQTDGNRLTSAPSDPPAAGTTRVNSPPSRSRNSPASPNHWIRNRTMARRVMWGTAPAGGEDRVDHRR